LFFCVQMVKCKTNTLTILMHQMCISTTQVSSRHLIATKGSLSRSCITWSQFPRYHLCPAASSVGRFEGQWGQYYISVKTNSSKQLQQKMTKKHWTTLLAMGHCGKTIALLVIYSDLGNLSSFANESIRRDFEYVPPHPPFRPKFII
jgi:hypothetical protein